VLSVVFRPPARSGGSLSPTTRPSTFAGFVTAARFAQTEDGDLRAGFDGSVGVVYYRQKVLHLVRSDSRNAGIKSVSSKGEWCVLDPELAGAKAATVPGSSAACRRTPRT